MTVLSITQEALQQLNTNFHASLLSATDPRQLQMRALLYAQSRFLRNEALWPQQKRTGTLSIASGRAFYPLPVDFHAFVFDAQYNSGAKMKLRRLQGDYEFSNELYAWPTGVEPAAIRIFGADGNLAAATGGGQLQVSPTPTASGTYTFEYYTKNLFYPPYWTAGETGIALNVYRFSNGNIYKCTTAGTGICASTPPSGTTTFAEAAGGPTWTYQNIAYETVLSDNDQSLWNDAVMVAGVKWRYLESKGQSFAAAKADHDRALQKDFSRFQLASVGSFSRQNKNPVRPGGDRYGGFSF